jgi:hypothetical protein
MEKRQSPDKGFAQLKKRYHKNIEALIIACSLQKHAIRLLGKGWMISQVFWASNFG